MRVLAFGVPAMPDPLTSHHWSHHSDVTRHRQYPVH
jgi:hypothetical protein